MLLVLLARLALVWVVNPFAALLLLPALHLWLLLASPELRPARAGSRSRSWRSALLPLALLVVFYAHQLGLGPGGVAWTAVLLLAGGHVGVLAALLWSLASAAPWPPRMLALGPAPAPRLAADDEAEITIRGPLSYAGPGSLGGTESALRR